MGMDKELEDKLGKLREHNAKFSEYKKKRQAEIDLMRVALEAAPTKWEIVENAENELKQDESMFAIGEILLKTMDKKDEGNANVEV